MVSPSHAANAHYSPASSLSSFSVLTSTPSDDPFEAIDESSSDEDEIVWPADPEEDFILIPHAHRSHSIPEVTGTPTPAHEPSHEALAQLSLTDSEIPTTPVPHARRAKPKHLAKGKGRRTAGGRSEVSGQSLASTAPAPPPRTHRGRRRRGKKDAAASYPSPSPSPTRELVDQVIELDPYTKRQGGFGARPLIEDSDGEGEPVVKRYEDAVSYITSFISDPSAALSRPAYNRLTFLQSLIIELGLISPSSTLPSSMKAAKHVLKTRAFINIAEYRSVREQGLDKLREIMFSSKRELTSDLRKRKNGHKADKGWVKRHGLNVLLVSVF